MSLYSKTVDLQKLKSAWERVRKNKPAAGVDNVTCEQFDQDLQQELKQLNLELIEHRYESLPVKKITIYKGEKARDIALYCMRDKVVQQSLAFELNKIYDAGFSPRTYAYRSNKSALIAIQDIADVIRDKGYSYFLKVDISKFFDCIDWKILRNILSAEIAEEDVMDLIRQNSCSRYLDEDTGELNTPKTGIYQGSILAPILSNVYLMEFDRWLLDSGEFFVRYSDDMIILSDSAQRLTELLQQIIIRLRNVGLRINTDKSVMGKVAEGFNFLGYNFDESGKSIPDKAEENLRDRLEMMWLTNAGVGFEEKVLKALEIIGGWKQYFREERDISSIIELAALAYAAGDNDEYLHKLADKRPDLENDYKDITEYLSGVWKDMGLWMPEMLEYESFYNISGYRQLDSDKEKRYKELLGFYRRFFALEDRDIALEIMQAYTDLGEYQCAEKWQEIINGMSEISGPISPELIPNQKLDEGKLIISKVTAQKMMKLFVGREDVYSTENIIEGNHRRSEQVSLPLTSQVMQAHLKGDKTIGTYIQRTNSTVHFMVIDVDISKRVMIRHSADSEQMESYLKKALLFSMDIRKELSKMGLKGYIEFSGHRGYHVWIFLTEWMPVRYANMLFDVLQVKMKDRMDDDITMEFFPNKTRVKGGKLGQTIKVPYGIHLKTGKRSMFLDDNGNPYGNIDYFADSIAKFTIGAIKKVLAVNTGIEESTDKKEVNLDWQALGELTPNVKEVLAKCTLMKYLCNKSVTTGYLSHFERLSVLYVFGHLGEDGKEFVHKVMSFTLNYKYNVTERFIRKMPEKPISCLKLRDQYKMITAEYGCDCVFKRTKNCYPSPVLHAIALSNDDQGSVTLPTSRTLSKEKEKKVIGEINIHVKAQELASEILKYRKEKRNIDKSIAKIEKQLGEVFDSAEIDSLEIEMGMLIRRRTPQGVDWVIEL